MTCQKPYSKQQSDVMYNALQDQIGSVVEDTYTQADIDQMLAGYSPTGHTHPYSPDTHNHDAAYSAVGHKHDSRYYKEDEIDQMLAGYSPTGHTHPYSPDTHNHDVQYYLKGEIDFAFTQHVPVGMVLFWPGSYLNLPTKWMYMDGTFLDSNVYPHLFSLIGYTYGQSGSLFALPNAGGRFILGSPDLGGIYELGWTGGQSDVTLTKAQMPPHDHYNNDAKNRTVDSSQPHTTGDGIVWSATEFRVKASDPLSEGGGQPHTNMPPYLCLFAVIKVLP